MAAGYIYVLVNSSMPGLVKVGKTTRTPSDRADELSGVSGVATPFIVAYEDYFGDCDAAESFVHTKLAEKGLRVSESREFFRAPVSDVVKVLASIAIPITSRPSCVDDNLLTADDDEFKNYQLGKGLSEVTTEPWAALLDTADQYYYGLGDCIQDYAEAIKLYRDAARLGSALAFERLGDMYKYGKGTREDNARAFGFFKEGAKAGDFFCYTAMATSFILENSIENARKCFSRFITDGEADGWKSYNIVEERHVGEMFHVLNCLYARGTAPAIQEQFARLAFRYKRKLISYGLACLSSSKASQDKKNTISTVIGHLEALA